MKKVCYPVVTCADVSVLPENSNDPLLEAVFDLQVVIGKAIATFGRQTAHGHLP